MTTEPSFAATFDISQVERDTGLTKDTLRVWERRYGFPHPARDRKGERRYCADDVQKLRLLKRLIDAGRRPGMLIGCSVAELSTLEAIPALAPDNGAPARSADLIGMLQMRDGQGLLQQLSRMLLRQGLQTFVKSTLAPLNVAVGEAWARGTIATFDEHLYTEQVKTLLRTVVLNMPRRAESPRVLLTTLPQEQHGIGLLMVEALLAAENISCVSLGTQTPLPDILTAADAHRADIVGLSFAASFPARGALDAIASLRKQLRPAVELWAGGALVQRLRNLPSGVTAFTSLEPVLPAIEGWRQRHATDAANRHRDARPPG